MLTFNGPLEYGVGMASGASAGIAITSAGTAAATKATNKNKDKARRNVVIFIFSALRKISYYIIQD